MTKQLVKIRGNYEIWVRHNDTEGIKIERKVGETEEYYRKRAIMVFEEHMKDMEKILAETEPIVIKTIAL